MLPEVCDMKLVSVQFASGVIGGPISMLCVLFR